MNSCACLQLSVMKCQKSQITSLCRGVVNGKMRDWFQTAQVIRHSRSLFWILPLCQLVFIKILFYYQAPFPVWNSVMRKKVIKNTSMVYNYLVLATKTGIYGHIELFAALLVLSLSKCACLLTVGVGVVEETRRMLWRRLWFHGSAADSVSSEDGQRGWEKTYRCCGETGSSKDKRSGLCRQPHST